MSDVEVKRWENSLLDISLWMIRCGKEFYFFGKEVALALGYTDPKEAIRDHIDPEDKISVKELLGSNYKMVLKRNFSSGVKMTPVDFFQKLRSNQKVINEFGIYSLCMRSRMPKVKPFQNE